MFCFRKPHRCARAIKLCLLIVEITVTSQREPPPTKLKGSVSAVREALPVREMTSNTKRRIVNNNTAGSSTRHRPPSTLAVHRPYRAQSTLPCESIYQRGRNQPTRDVLARRRLRFLSPARVLYIRFRAHHVHKVSTPRRVLSGTTAKLFHRSAVFLGGY